MKNGRKKKSSGIIVFFLITLLMFAMSVCESQAQQSNKEKVWVLKYADQNPKSDVIDMYVLPWIEEVHKATNGRVKIEPYYSQTLCKGSDAWEAVKVGITDLAFCFHGFWPGLTDLSDVVTLPFMNFKSAEHASGILWKLYEKFPEIREQYKDNVVLALYTSTPYFFITRKKHIKEKEDIRGMKIRVPGGPPTDMITLLGGSPMMISMVDTYTALQKGTYDGMGITWMSIKAWRHYEVVKYYTYIPLFTVYFSLPINRTTWESFPDDIQQQIMSVSGHYGSKVWGKRMFDITDKSYPPQLRAQGVDMVEYTVPQEKIVQWQEVAGKPIWDKWVKKMEDKGHKNAQKILSATLNLIETYNLED